MKKNIGIILLLMAIASPATSESSEVFKCITVTGKVAYQSTPCTSGVAKQKVIEIQSQNLREIKEAQNRLNAWRAELAVSETAKMKEAKELQIEIDRQETNYALNLIAIALQQQAIATRRHAEAFYWH